MGQSSMNVTLERDGHRFPELDESIAMAFDAHLGAQGQLRPALAQLGNE